MSAAPWSVKGIDPKAREIAKDLARRSGMTLGEWLNGMILEDEGSPPDRSAGDRSAGRYARASTSAAPNANAPFFPQAGEGDRGIRYEAPQHPSDETGRMAEALERLSSRIEASEQSASSVIKTIEQSVRHALARLDADERDRVAVSARFEGALQELQSDQSRIAERLRGLESDQEGPKASDAVKTLESAMSKMAGYVYEGEGATREALTVIDARLAQIEAAKASGSDEDALNRIGARLEAAEARTTNALLELGASFQAMDTRLKGLESDGGSGVEHRLEAMAGDLARRIEQVRSEMAEQLRDATDGRFDRMHRAMGEMTDHVQAAEKRSARAIEMMGREVLNIAEGLGRRLQGVESRSADAIEKVGGEVARIGVVMDQRIARADMVQAQALEKLGSEITRITERLSERIANAERRNASAIDEVGEQVGRVTERIAERNDRSASELSERIRQSEERTAKLLDDARQKIDASLEASQKKLEDHLASIAAPVAAARRPQEARSPFAGDEIRAAAFEQPSANPASWSSQGGVQNSTPFSQDDFDAVESLFREHRFSEVEGASPARPDAVPGSSSSAARTEPGALFLDGPAPGGPLSTREVIEQARSSARAAAQPEPRAPRRPAEKTSLFKGFSFGGKKPGRNRSSATLQTALVMAGAAAAAGSGLAGYMLYYARPTGAPPARVAQALEGARPAPVGAAEGVAPAVANDEVRAAVAISPTPLNDPAAEAPTADLGPIFEGAVRRIEAKDRSGLVDLRKAANLGYAPAQFYLAKLYENGDAGIKKDLAEARRWTERAALSGDRKAMHNMALYAFEGAGGPKNSTIAAQWFRKAADLGLVDSQYNLGRLYEEGFGVSQNAAEAYKWYLIAAKAGDAEARTSAARVKAVLSVDAQSAAERSAGIFRPATANPSAQLAPGAGAAGLITAQKALSRLGYYQGPTDGAASPALRLALTAWQRDQGLTPTGRIDAEAVSRLSVFVQ